jgi:hypothetical protein
MRTAITTLQMLIRVTGLLEIVLGLAFWTGNLRNLIPLHMLIGLVFVLALWVLAVLAVRSGVNRGFVALVLVWGLIVLILGVTQTQLLPGAAHWVIEVLHLLVGLAAIGLAGALGARLATMSKQAQAPVLSAQS